MAALFTFTLKLFFLTGVTPWNSLWGTASGGCELGSPSYQTQQHSEPHCAASPGPLGSFPSCIDTKQGCKMSAWIMYNQCIHVQYLRTGFCQGGWTREVVKDLV